MSAKSSRRVTVTLIGLGLVVFVVFPAAAQQKPEPVFALAIHGGAGVEPDKLTPENRQAHLHALRTALDVGLKILADGGTALDTVEATVRVLEDEPLFNAGRGAVFNNIGKHELDAAIVDGRQRACGAVAGITTVKNPISLARLVMTKTSHVLLAGEGADKFADEMSSEPSIERVPNEFFSTEHRRREWLEAVAPEQAKTSPKPPGKGTVGCVALDMHGDLAAGTSTGGLTNKKWGRIGSVPIVGAGTFADNSTCAISGTGIGEEFIRHSVGFQLHALMKFRALHLKAAVNEMVQTILPPDTAGIIAIDRHGAIHMQCNTPGMSRASAHSSGQIIIALEP